MPAQPNILFIHVDEMRFPMHLPPDYPTEDAFLAKFMPNLYSIWTKGVKFFNYYTGAADCTPGRGTFVTGLYAYQTNLFLTRENSSNPYATSQPQPPLNEGFQTYGKLLKNIPAPLQRYDTPYIGKWHLSNSPASPESSDFPTYLNTYGFQGLTAPDPLGMPGQGLGIATPQYPGAPPPIGDPEIAEQAVRWLYDRSKNNPGRPFCLTVGFVNPHDKQFFWGATQANQFNAVYNTIPDPTSVTDFELPGFNFKQTVVPPPAPRIYPKDWKPINWESGEQLKLNKPPLQSLFKDMFSYYWTGTIDEVNDPARTHFYAEQSDYDPTKHDAVAPHEYWGRALDFYTQMMSAVDVHIGSVIHNIPKDLADNTVIVFSADHGEYASSHGLQGKGASVYRECFNVPLIVCDLSPTERYTKYPNTKREQLVSSVDLLRMLVTLGYGGSQSWLTGDYAAMWGGNLRADLYSMLQTDSKTLGGRDYVIFSTDEFFSVTQANAQTPQHVIGLLTKEGVAKSPNAGKLGFYHHWIEDTTAWNRNKPFQYEYYNYGNPDGKNEKLSTPNSPQAGDAEVFLHDFAIPDQLKKGLPPTYVPFQDAALRAYWEFVRRADVQSLSTAFA
jgi:uncharacterized sulfatase